MYSRPPSRDPRLPPNYGGSIFSRNNTVTPVEDLTKSKTPPPHTEESLPSPACQGLPFSDTPDGKDMQDDSVTACAVTEEKSSLLSPLGHLGTEELLLIALALMIFQDGKDPQLGLILLALLFIN